MRYAMIGADDRIEPTPKGRAACPNCAAPVAAKCGSIVTPHWAHVAREDCDDWAEADTAWHRGWQECVAPEHREVVLGHHRADIFTRAGYVVELQHSSISADQIAEREAFYGPRMIWVFDAQDAYTDDRLILRDRGDHMRFRWKHPRKTVAACARPVYLDLGKDRLLHVKKIYPDAPCRGWGLLGTATALQEWISARAYAEVS